MAETVSDINGGGNDYATLILWEADKDGDITAGNAEVAEVYASINDAANHICILAGWTTDSDSYVAIRAGVARSSSNPLRAGQAVTLTASRALGRRYCVQVQSGCEFFRVDGLDCIVDQDVDAYDVIRVSFGGAPIADVRISNMVVAQLGASKAMGLRFGESDDNTAHVFKYWNNVVYGCTKGIECSWNSGTDSKHYLYNNTVYGCSDHGIDGTYPATMVSVNNVAYDCTNDDFEGTYDAPSDYNFSKDDTAPEAAGNSIWGDTDGKTPDFVNTGAGTEDFHLQASSDAIDEGTDDPGSGLYSTDIDRVTWTSPWDMGAVQYAAVAANDLLLLQNTNLRGNLQDLRGGLR